LAARHAIPRETLNMHDSIKAGIAAAILAAPLLAASTAGAQAARDYVSIVGSSTVYPFATVAAEQFGKTSRFKTPKVESTGSGGGIKLFCGGVGVQFPDMANSSRALKASEYAACGKNGVREIVEIKLGYDGIVLARARQGTAIDLTLRDVFLALAREVPKPDGSPATVPNPYKTWKDVNPKLPADAIEVLGPPPTSGTRDAFVELAMEGGCATFPWIAKLKSADEAKYKRLCQTIREDGRFVEAGENDNLIVQKLRANPKAVGVFGYSFLEQNEDVVRGARVNGVEPTFEAIADSSYPVSRPLFVYVKKAHVGTIPGIREFVAELVSTKAMGEEGYLADRGLVPLPAAEYQRVAKQALALTPMAPPRQ
jgi:phosphate transport system substrate-binding protein